MHLVIDTSTKTGAIGLCKGPDLLAFKQWKTEQNHTAELLPALDSLVLEVGIDLKQLSAIGAVKGPGGFSSLRAGILTVQGLAYGLGKPVIAVNALDVLAAASSHLAYSICALVEVGRKQVVSLMQVGGVSVKRTGPMAIEDVIATTAPGTVFVSNGYVVNDETIRNNGFQSAVIDFESLLSELGKLVLMRIESGDVSEPGKISPEYSRDPNIGVMNKK